MVLIKTEPISTQFQDCSVLRSGRNKQTNDELWGVLVNERFTTTGDCQSEFRNGDRGFWGNDELNANAVLVVSTLEHLLSEVDVEL